MNDNYGDYIYKNNQRISSEFLSQDSSSNERDGNGNLIKDKKCENCGKFVSTKYYNIHVEQCLNFNEDSDNDKEEFDPNYHINSQIRDSVDMRGFYPMIVNNQTSVSPQKEDSYRLMKSVEKSEKEVDLKNDINADRYSKANSFMIINNSNDKNEINSINEINNKYYNNEYHKIDFQNNVESFKYKIKEKEKEKEINNNNIANSNLKNNFNNFKVENKIVSQANNPKSMENLCPICFTIFQNITNYELHVRHCVNQDDADKWNNFENQRDYYNKNNQYSFNDLHHRIDEINIPNINPDYRHYNEINLFHNDFIRDNHSLSDDDRESQLNNSNFSYEELLRLDENVTHPLLTTYQSLLNQENFTADIISKLNTENKQCMICFDDFEVGQKFIRLPCFHLFHSHEISHWFERNKTCPMCRLDVESMLKDY